MLPYIRIYLETVNKGMQIVLSLIYVYKTKKKQILLVDYFISLLETETFNKSIRLFTYKRLTQATVSTLIMSFVEA